MAELTKKCVLITGSTGFIGRALCAAILQKGWEVRCVCRKGANVDALPKGVQVLFLDSIENCDSCGENFMGVDTIIHLAAHVHMLGHPANNSLDIFRKINVLGTKHLANLAARVGIKRFIFISSVKVNGEGALLPYTENDPPAPQDAYAISKLEAEQALASVAANTGLKTVVLRLPLVYGPGVKANFKNLIKLIGMGLPLPFKVIHNRRSFLYLGNLVDAIIVCVNHPLAVGETFLVSDGQDVSTPDLIKMIACAMNKNPVLFSLHPGILKALCKIAGKTEELDKLTRSLLINSNKIRNVLGWKPPFCLEEGIKETIKYYKT